MYKERKGLEDRVRDNNVDKTLEQIAYPNLEQSNPTYSPIPSSILPAQSSNLHLNIARHPQKPIYFISNTVYSTPVTEQQLYQMWKAVGTVNPQDNKQNRSKDEVNCEPFGQASRLRLNQSHLSGQKSHQFMNEYFTKRRSPESTLHRVLSQKTVEVRQANSPPASLRQIESLKNINRTEVKLGQLGQQGSLHELEKALEMRQAELQTPGVAVSARCERIVEELKVVRQEQVKLSKLIASKMGSFKQELKVFEREVAQRLQKMEAEREKSSRENVNPQLLAKIKQDGARFNEKMKELDLRKEQIRGRYKDRNRFE